MDVDKYDQNQEIEKEGFMMTVMETLGSWILEWIPKALLVFVVAMIFTQDFLKASIAVCIVSPSLTMWFCNDRGDYNYRFKIVVMGILFSLACGFWLWGTPGTDFYFKTSAFSHPFIVSLIFGILTLFKSDTV